MAPIPPGAFADALRDLDGDAFASLVADLWGGCGWDVERDGQVVRVAHRGESRDLLVLPPHRFARGRLARLRRAPATDDSIDAVVTASRAPSRAALPRGLPAEADVIDAGDLRERALYGIDADDAEAVADRYFGVPLLGSRWSTSSRATARGVLPELPSALPPFDASDGSRSAIAAVAVVVLVLATAIAVGAPATLLQTAGDASPAGANGDASSGAVDDDGTGGAASDAPTGEEVDDGTAEDGAGGSGPSDTGEREGEPLPGELRNRTDLGSLAFDLDDRNATWSDLYEATPTCDRTPRAVARLLAAGFTGPHPDRALGLYWRFVNPDFRASTDYGSFVGTHRAAYQRVFHADRIDLGEQRRVAEAPPRVVIDATVQWDDDSRGYEFELRRWTSGNEECWVVDRFSPPLD